MQPAAISGSEVSVQVAGRAKKLHALGVLCGFTAGAWLGAAEAPTKLVSVGVSPLVISLIMVIGVFLARWSLPALIIGTSSIRADVQRSPHLIVWALLAGCMWAVANTLTIFAIRDIGLSIAFPLWNSNSLLGIFWGFVFFRELRQAGWRRWTGVLGGALIMCVGATLLAIASSTQAPAGHSMRGVWAALGAGILWGTMYIPYRKAYLSGMNPLSFVTFFTVGELGMMTALAVHYLGGFAKLWQQLEQVHQFLFWLLAAGFVWVIGDIFQQYAVKYIGVSRGIPLSNSNQLWGLLWGAVAFGEFRTWGQHAVANAVYGCVLMAAGLAAISLSAAGRSEYEKWCQAAGREQRRYRIDAKFVSSGLEGRSADRPPSRKWFDWILIGIATTVFVWTGMVARWPSMDVNWPVVVALMAAGLTLFASAAFALW